MTKLEVWTSAPSLLIHVLTEREYWPCEWSERIEFIINLI
jgi:hypothetical protein